MRGLLEWLFSEAGAGWIVGAVSVAALIFFQIRQHRPSRLCFREVKLIQPVEIREGIRAKVRISFGDKLVDALGQLEAELYNSGSTTIEDAEIAISFPENATILDVALRDAPSGFSISATKSAATIRMPFLNPVAEHRERYLVSFVLDTLPERVEIRGGGKGWSVNHIPLPTPRERRRYVIIAGASILASFVTSLPYVAFVWWKWDIPPQEVSLRAFHASLPLILAYGVIAVNSVRLWRKSLRGV